MAVEILSFEGILGMMIAFFVGLGSLHLVLKLRSTIKTRNSVDSMHVTRLEYYEKQLIDMKIRLDVLEQGVTQKPTNTELGRSLEILLKNAIREQNITQDKPETQSASSAHNLEYGNAADHVLRLITDKAMTSRDIQITLKRSREHTSRLLKKLFEEGFVQRTQTKPYSYQITQKGREKILVKSTDITAT